jgi:hypothetical protein
LRALWNVYSLAPAQAGGQAPQQCAKVQVKQPCNGIYHAVSLNSCTDLQLAAHARSHSTDVAAIALALDTLLVCAKRRR